MKYNTNNHDDDRMLGDSGLTPEQETVIVLTAGCFTFLVLFVIFIIVLIVFALLK